MTGIDDKKMRFRVFDEIHCRHKLDKRLAKITDKEIYLQLIEFKESGEKQLRLGYYMIGVKPGMKGRWVWGQYCAIVPKREMEWLIRKAKAKGWINP